MITIGTSVTWAYINNQLDFKKRYAVHVVTSNGMPLCGRGRELDEVTDTNVEFFMKYDWGCKLCKRKLTKEQHELH